MERYRELAADDPIQIGWDANEAEFHAKTKIFSVLADAMEYELGKEEGRAAVARARKRQGDQMGADMAAKVREKGEPLNLNNFFEVFWSYFQWSPKFDTERYFDDEGNMVKYVLRLNCPDRRLPARQRAGRRVLLELLRPRRAHRPRLQPQHPLLAQALGSGRLPVQRAGLGVGHRRRARLSHLIPVR